MKIKTQRNQNKKIIWAGIIVLILLGVIAGALYHTHSWPFRGDSKDTRSLSEEQKGTGEQIKSDVIDQDNSGKETTGSDATPSPTPSTTGGKASVASYNSSLSQDTNGVYIRSVIQTVTSSGTCTLKMTGPNGTTYTDTSEVQAMPSFTSCKGFDVPRSKLAAGTWTITVSFENDELVSSYTTSVEVK